MCSKMRTLIKHALSRTKWAITRRFYKPQNGYNLPKYSSCWSQGYGWYVNFMYLLTFFDSKLTWANWANWLVAPSNNPAKFRFKIESYHFLHTKMSLFQNLFVKLNSKLSICSCYPVKKLLMRDYITRNFSCSISSVNRINSPCNYRSVAKTHISSDDMTGDLMRKEPRQFDNIDIIDYIKQNKTNKRK